MRARRWIGDVRIPDETPGAIERSERAAAVTSVVYLMISGGYRDIAKTAKNQAQVLPLFRPSNKVPIATPPTIYMAATMSEGSIVSRSVRLADAIPTSGVKSTPSDVVIAERLRFTIDMAQ